MRNFAAWVVGLHGGFSIGCMGRWAGKFEQVQRISHVWFILLLLSCCLLLASMKTISLLIGIISKALGNKKVIN